MAEPTTLTRARPLLAVLVGAVLAAVIALILGEYPFVGTTPYLAAALVPAIIGFAVVGAAGSAPGRPHPARPWLYTGVISAAGVGWALWISTGRGVDPTPVGGWVAIGGALLWPLVWAAVLTRRASTRRTTPGGPAASRAGADGSSPGTAAPDQVARS